uniref:Uncharacterized protein n=1 Tax=Avena sativa TaxID=4498 RepID=A0ACD5W0M2_AVESA
MARSMNPYFTTMVLLVFILVLLANHGQCRNLDQDMENGTKLSLPGRLCMARSCEDMSRCYCCLIGHTCYPTLVTCISSCAGSYSTHVHGHPPIESNCPLHCMA